MAQINNTTNFYVFLQCTINKLLLLYQSEMTIPEKMANNCNTHSMFVIGYSSV